MELLQFIAVIAALFIVFYVLELLFRKWLKVEKEKITDPRGKKIDRWGRGIILVIVLCFIPFMFSGTGERILWFWMIYLTALNGFQAFLEWRYIKGSRLYLVTLLQIPLTIAVLLCIVFIYT